MAMQYLHGGYDMSQMELGIFKGHEEIKGTSTVII